MSRDSQLKAGIIAAVILLDVFLVWSRDLIFPLEDLIRPICTGVSLLAAAWFYKKRGVENFVLCLLALAHVTMFTSGYTTLMYGAATFNTPLVDQQLVQFDQFFGFHLPTIVDWSDANPEIAGWLQLAYDTMLLQTALVVIVLGFQNQRVPLEQFVLQFMVSTLICLLGLAAIPAIGPYDAYGYAVTEPQALYLEHIYALRSGAMRMCSWRDAQGLITFPSFHTAWAVLLAWAFRKNKLLCIPALLVNAAVIASTLTTGWHYFADVVGGVALGAGSIWLVAASRSHFYHPDGRPVLVSESLPRPVSQPAA